MTTQKQRMNENPYIKHLIEVPLAYFEPSEDSHSSFEEKFIQLQPENISEIFIPELGKRYQTTPQGISEMKLDIASSVIVEDRKFSFQDIGSLAVLAAAFAALLFAAGISIFSVDLLLSTIIKLIYSI